MKKGWKKIAVGILAGCMLCTTALAYECYITPSYQSVSRGAVVSSTTETNGRSAEPVLSDSMPEAMLDYQEERADWIFQKFEMNPDDYNYAWFYELSSYVGTDAFVTIFDIIDLPAGATSDSYFVNNAMDTVYCVFQDKDAVNYLYEFTKEDDVWQLSKVETRQDEGKYSETQQSYADYEQQLLGA